MLASGKNAKFSTRCKFCKFSTQCEFNHFLEGIFGRHFWKAFLGVPFSSVVRSSVNRRLRRSPRGTLTPRNQPHNSRPRDRTHASRAPAPPRAPRAASCVSVRTEHNPDNAWRAVFSRITLITCGPPAHRCTADAPMAQPRSHRYVAPCRPTPRCAGVRGQQAPAQLHSSRPTPSPRSVS